MITLERLQAVSDYRPERLAMFVQPLQAACAEYGIDNPAREAAFLAQIAHESGGFRFMREIWGPTDQQRKYEPPSHKAQDLGNVVAGDGFRFRGRGLIQITGRANYAATGAALELPLLNYPELLEEPGHAARSAGHFWKMHGLNELADVGDFEKISRRINGGLTGYAERLALLEKAQALA